ncbi:MAG: hypothetical protein WC091_09955, partial [Sulfuricellaceae bacterium]
LHGFPGAWRRCNSKRRQWNDHCASLRLALHPENRTLQPVQLSFLGLSIANFSFLCMLVSSTACRMSFRSFWPRATNLPLATMPLRHLRANRD